MAQIIDGKAVSAAVKQEVAEETARLKDEKGLKIGYTRDCFFWQSPNN